jgi:hypothetical protein
MAEKEKKHLQDLQGSDVCQGQRYGTWQAIVVESAILAETYQKKW